MPPHRVLLQLMTNTPPPTSLPNESVPGAVYDPSGEGRRGFDFRHFWHSILERLWVVALCVVAGLFLALGYLARTPKLYQSHAVLEVEFQEPTMVTGDETSSACAPCSSPARKRCARSNKI